MDRRTILKGGFAAPSLFLPVPYAWVWAQQSDGALKLLRAPKIALVIGNGKYKDAPELKNAPNDAKAVSETLKASGFAVTMLLDTGREALVNAIRDYVNAMGQKKAVGLFYFAGHGVQLEWRNYMLPVDAVIDTVEDVAKASVDVARLMEGLTKAANPMNVIILDACREDPFGKSRKTAQKGLSQMDAPTQTLLAYATSPGNVASDGDGVNGLYTENLLKEMRVPEAKIEDVFKRVRLAVRRKTNGAQIPWETTSLEDDFWFIPPKELKKLSDAEKERAFKEQLALWEKIQKATEPGPFEDYLRRFPSGDYAELAQLQLDRVLAKQGEKRVEIVNAAANPYTKGSARADTHYVVGDTYNFSEYDIYTKVVERSPRLVVKEITDNEILWGNGFVSDLLGNNVRLPNGARYTPNQTVPLEFSVGRQWTTRFVFTNQQGIPFSNEMDYRIAARERITIAAGTFDAFRVEGNGISIGGGGDGISRIANKQWYAPAQVRVAILGEFLRRQRNNVVAESRRRELMSFKQS